MVLQFLINLQIPGIKRGTEKEGYSLACSTALRDGELIQFIYFCFSAIEAEVHTSTVLPQSWPQVLLILCFNFKVKDVSPTRLFLELPLLCPCRS